VTRHSTRAVSTAVDVSVFVVLMAAATGALVLPTPASPSPGVSAPAAEGLATATLDVTYELTPDGDVGVPPDSPELDRAAHGTAAELLAAAAVQSVAVDDRRVTRTHDGFRRALGAAVEPIAGRYADGVQVRAVWTPYPEAPVAGRFVVGGRPPASATVDAAVLTVSSGLPAVRSRALAAASRDGYDGVAGVLADGIVRGHLAPNATRLELHGDPPVDAIAARRYRRFAALTGTHTGPALRRADTGAVNDRIRDALERRLADDLEAEFRTPSAAARAVRVGTVRIEVRTWSP